MTEKVPPLIERCATLRRVSDDAQDVRNQQAELDAYVAGRYRVVKTYDLPDLSASKGLKRHEAALDEIVEDFRAGKYTVLVVVHSSRLDRRDEDDQVELLLRIRKAGGRVESVRQPQYGKTDIAGRVLTLLSQFENAQYSRDLSGHVQAANAAIDAVGGFRGGRVPVGYRVEGKARRSKRIVPDEATAPLVREVFEHIRASQPVPLVVSWLAEVHGIQRTNASLCQIVRRATYWSGRYEITDSRGVTQVHMVEPIVDAQLWRDANANLDARPSTNPHPRAPRQPDLSGSLFCGTCEGRTYRCYGGDEPKRIRYYRCLACKVQWRADESDEEVEKLMSGDTSPEWEIITVAPAEHRAQKLQMAEDALRELSSRGLPDDEEDRIRRELRAERDQIRAMPEDPKPRRELHLTGQTHGDAWNSMVHAERVAYLRSGQFKVLLHVGTRKTALGKIVRDSKQITAERKWLPQVIEVQGGADLGGIRAVLAMGMPVLWSDAEPSV